MVMHHNDYVWTGVGGVLGIAKGIAYQIAMIGMITPEALLDTFVYGFVGALGGLAITILYKLVAWQVRKRFPNAFK